MCDTKLSFDLLQRLMESLKFTDGKFVGQSQ